jgi:hypothetical protein
MFQLLSFRCAAAIVVWFALAGGGSVAVDGFLFLEKTSLAGPLRIDSHRAMRKLTQEETALYDQCLEASEALFKGNAALDTSITEVVEYGTSEINKCLSGAATALTSPKGFVCNVDIKAYEDGSPYDEAVATCIEAGGVAVVVSVEVDCAGTTDAGSSTKASVQLLNVPDCVLSEEVEPACDPDLIKRVMEASFANLFGELDMGCTTTSTFELFSGNGESGGSGGTGTSSGSDSSTTDGQDSVGRSASRSGLAKGLSIGFVFSSLAVGSLVV